MINIPSVIESSNVENVKLRRKKNCNKLNRNNLIKLMNLNTLKLPIDFVFEPLHDFNDKATDKLFTSFVSMLNDNGKAPAIFDFAIIIYSQFCYLQLVVDLQVILSFGDS